MRECWYCHAKVASNEASRCPECRAELEPVASAAPKPAPVPGVVPPADVSPPKVAEVHASLVEPAPPKVAGSAPVVVAAAPAAVAERAATRLADFTPARPAAAAPPKVVEVAPEPPAPALGRKAAALARIASSRPEPVPEPKAPPPRDEESDGVELVPLPPAAVKATWWADVLFGGKNATVLDDAGITTYELAAEKWRALGTPLPSDPSAIAPHAEKRSRLRFEQIDRVATDFTTAQLTISAQGAEHSIFLPDSANPAAFEAIKRRTPHLALTKELAPIASIACGPTCSLMLIGVIGGPMYMAAHQIANERPGQVFTGYRSARKQGLHDLLQALGPSGTLAIILALVVLCVGRAVLRFLARPSISVLRRAS